MTKAIHFWDLVLLFGSFDLQTVDPDKPVWVKAQKFKFQYLTPFHQATSVTVQCLWGLQSGRDFWITETSTAPAPPGSVNVLGGVSCCENKKLFLAMAPCPFYGLGSHRTVTSWLFVSKCFIISFSGCKHWTFQGPFSGEGMTEVLTGRCLQGEMKMIVMLVWTSCDDNFMRAIWGSLESLLSHVRGAWSWVFQPRHPPTMVDWVTEGGPRIGP